MRTEIVHAPFRPVTNFDWPKNDDLIIFAEDYTIYVEYKNEGYDMFLEMMINMRRNVIYSMFMFQPAKKTS